MQYRLSTDSVEITDEDRALIDKKLERIAKLVSTPYVTDIRITRDRHHRNGDVLTCTINVEQGKKVFHASRSSDTVQTALDETLEALQQELKKHHDAEVARRREIKRAL